jgi:hypothetical protein
MIIHSDFTGGNIRLLKIENDVIYLENELRDTTQDWFYWAFCVEGAKGKTLSFRFKENRVGYFGPAISYDLKNWRWLGSSDGEGWTYTFKKGENKVYFAHDMLYLPERFSEFTNKNGLSVSTLCKSRKGRLVPALKFGDGKKSIILTARHHACEGTGSYVLEGVLTYLLKNTIPDTTVFCVPFVDFDGVLDGDQGKSRFPHDHNRDYRNDEEPIYPETAAIISYAQENGCHFGFDFHSPWHKGGVNDKVFIVQNLQEKLSELNAFAFILEKNLLTDAHPYSPENDFPPNTDWNTAGPQFAIYMAKRPENRLSFTLETTYFGEKEYPVTEKGLLLLGESFGAALKEYVK